MHKSLIKLFFLFLPFFSNTGYGLCLTWLQDYQPPGFYINAYGGINGGYDLGCRQIKTARGYYCGLNAGKKVFPNLRLEGDIGWQGSKMDSIHVEESPLESVEGSLNIGSIMANAIFDFNFPFQGSPSIGAGVGYANAKGHWSGNLTKKIENLFEKEHLKSSVQASGLAWQFIVNLNFFVCPKLKICVEYRYFRLDHEFNNYKFGLSIAKFF